MKNLIILLLALFVGSSAFAQVNATINSLSNTATTDKIQVQFTSTMTLTGGDLNPINVWLKVPGDGSGITWTLTDNPFGLVPGASFAFGGNYYRVFQSVTPQGVGTFPMGTPVTVAEIDITGFDGTVELNGGEFGTGTGTNVPGSAMLQGTTNLLNWPLALPVSLPITLRTFDVAKKGDDAAKLNWVTSSEENASHFEVERSVDGKIWSQIGKVEAVGNSVTDQYYQFDDSNLKAIPNADKIFYYRLRAVDLSDEFDYSAVKNIKLDFAGIAVSIYPNPTSEGIWIRMTQGNESREALSYSLVDISGKIIQAGNLGNAAEINEYIALADEVANGTYMLNIDTPTQNLRTERVVVVGQQ